VLVRERPRRHPSLFSASSGVVIAYVGVGVFALSAAWALGVNPLETSAWLGTSGVAAATMSAGFGAMIAVATIAATRVLLRRTAWARALHDDLRPVVRDESDGTLVFMALASGIGEELLFRGLVVPLGGVIVSAALFGLVHQVRGPARWGFMAWATIMGLAFALLFRFTGSLVGPIVAHVAINAANLRVLRDVDPAPRRRRVLGGILGRT
jgi:membrane protease YdiL (CAAX protease family)